MGWCFYTHLQIDKLVFHQLACSACQDFSTSFYSFLALRIVDTDATLCMLRYGFLSREKNILPEQPIPLFVLDDGTTYRLLFLNLKTISIKKIRFRAGEYETEDHLFLHVTGQ